jgi:hypothetical protein
MGALVVHPMNPDNHADSHLTTSLKRTTNVFWPIALVTLGGLLTVIGGLWTGIRDAKEARESAQAQKEFSNQILTLQAYLGDSKATKELVDTYSRLLAADRPASDNMINDIITNLPTATEDYKSLQEATDKAYKETDAKIRIGWEPLIRFVIDEFDRSIAELQQKGFEIKVEQNNDFPITRPGNDEARYNVRLATIRDLSLTLSYKNGAITPQGIDPCLLSIVVSESIRSDLRLESWISK